MTGAPTPAGNLPPFSVLDLVPIAEGSTAHQAMRNSVELARLADRLSFARYWLAEHHGMPSIASSAPEILIGHMAGVTERIRVGSGGVMLQNHVPLKLAESFHTLQTLYPGRIDMGIGRAPGTDPVTSQALRPFDPARFSEQLAELIGLSEGNLPDDHPFRRVRVIPAEAELPPIWLLGSSGASARLAGELGFGYSFASHFSPTPPGPALETYRASFSPSKHFAEPHTILGLSVICADSDEEAEFLASSMDLMWVRIHRNQFLPIPSPEEASAHSYTAAERAVADRYRSLVVVGSPERVHDRLTQLAGETAASELMITSTMFDHGARLRCYELLAGLREHVAPAD